MRHSDGINNRTWFTAGIWVIATVAIGMVLHQGARILAPFAMAIFVWLVMEGFARAIRRHVERKTLVYQNRVVVFA